MLWSFLTMFINVPMLILALTLLGIGAAIYFTLGPIKLLSIVLDARTWILVGGLVVGVTFWQSAHTIQQQKEEIASVETEQKAGKDSQAVVTNLIKKTQHRQTQAAIHQAIIDAAKPGDELDALLDEIQNEQTANNNSGR